MGVAASEARAEFADGDPMTRQYRGSRVHNNPVDFVLQNEMDN
jgi:hypothetical protein